jgi:hypothetical protein
MNMEAIIFFISKTTNMANAMLIGSNKDITCYSATKGNISSMHKYNRRIKWTNQHSITNSPGL